MKTKTVKPKTSKKAIKYPENSSIDLNLNHLTETPLSFPSTRDLNSMLLPHGYVIGNKRLTNLGFELTPSHLSEPGKANLSYEPNALTVIQTGTQQDFISFTRKEKPKGGYGQDTFRDWEGYFQNKGKITISFDPHYIPENANIIIRVGGSADFYGGTFNFQFEGHTTPYPLLAISGFQAINISKLINPTHTGSLRIKPLGDITIEAPFLYTWKFFSASYNGMIIQKII